MCVSHSLRHLSIFGSNLTGRTFLRNTRCYYSVFANGSVLTELAGFLASSVTHRVINAPHEDAQDGIARPEHLHLLLHEVFLFRLSLRRQDHHGTGNGPRVTESSHDQPTDRLSCVLVPVESAVGAGFFFFLMATVTKLS